MDAKNTQLALTLRSALKFFGNPPNYPIGNDESGRYEEQDPAYPSLIPLIDIHFDNPPANPLQFYREFTKKYSMHEYEILNGKIKRQELFSQQELVIADESWALVSFIDLMFYRTFDLPKTKFALAAPLFPYDAIKERCGYCYEDWLRFGPNDELMDTIDSLSIETI